MNALQRFIHFPIILACVAGIHVLLRNNLFSFALLPIVMPVIITYMLSTPLILLIPLAVLAEFFTTLPPGVLSLVILLPYAMRKIFTYTEPSLSLRYWATIGLTIAFQLSAILSVEIVRIIRTTDLSWSAFWAWIPWLPALLALLLSTMTSGGIIMIWYEFARPTLVHKSPLRR